MSKATNVLPTPDSPYIMVVAYAGNHPFTIHGTGLGWPKKLVARVRK
jgi:hypothetical protein